MAQAKTVQFSAEDSGKTVTTAHGDIIEVKLKGNPTTGYQWMRLDEAQRKEEGSVVFLDSSYGQGEWCRRGMMGCGGEYTFRFQAEGDGRVALVYRRSWETQAPHETFTLNVRCGNHLE
eukprot:m51a1_g5506 hypothetical protein (119) ;mRNA; f:375205-375668